MTSNQPAPNPHPRPGAARSVGTVTALSSATFDEAVAASEVPVLVDFTAAWCSHCAQLDPVLHALAAEQADRLAVARVDIDADPDLAARHRVMSAPTIVLYVDGRPVHTIVGARSGARLLEDLAPHL